MDFVGDSGPGAAIDLYLPQPGQRVGRRLIQIALQGWPTVLQNLRELRRRELQA